MKKKIKLNKDYIYKSVSKILKISPENLKKKDNLTSIGKWDSLIHLEIISKLDKLFKGKLGEASDISNTTSMKKILNILKKKNLIE
jgi:acyl carrier protein|tara:strand:- start:2585 stop:2842 length:258 start_codon:yes stop_codon:yes gene_type:complete